MQEVILLKFFNVYNIVDKKYKIIKNRKVIIFEKFMDKTWIFIVTNI